MVDFYHIYGRYKPSDILSKYWNYTKIWGIFWPLIFWMGDTIDFLNFELKMDGGQEKWERQKPGRFNHF